MKNEVVEKNIENFIDSIIRDFSDYQRLNNLKSSEFINFTTFIMDTYGAVKKLFIHLEFQKMTPEKKYFVVYYRIQEEKSTPVMKILPI